ncbi:MAG: GFA family protein [Pseudomonadota bacterium]
MTEPKTLTGRCLCGAVRFEAAGPPLWVGHCHCDSCRRATSSPITTFFAVSRGATAWTAGAPKVFESSPGVRRLFCGDCGAPMAFIADHYPEEEHLYVAALDAPAALAPSEQFHADERLPWMPSFEDLPHR